VHRITVSICFLLLFVSTLFVTTVFAQSKELKVAITGTKDIYSSGEEIQVRISYENVGERSILLWPSFVPHVPETGWPDTFLEFLIQDTSGNRVPFDGGSLKGGYREAPTPAMFTVLQPGEFFGFHIKLGKGLYRHAFNDVEGEYIIEAVAHFRVWEWMDERLESTEKRDKTASYLYDRRDMLVRGTIKSNKIFVRVAPKSR
jgi:hypothetical protein